MNGKYASPARFRTTQAYRTLLRAMIRPLVRWRPMRRPERGYTLIIGCNGELAELLLGNMHCLGRQQLAHLKQVLVVFDCPATALPKGFKRRVREQLPGVPIDFIYYTGFQRAVCRVVRWGWLNAWLSWSLGLGETRTRHAVLHDFDAMLIDPDFLERRYRAIRDRDCEYLGFRAYSGNGIESSDGLAVTFEMFCDVAFLRQRFRPIDLFNHVAEYNGRTVDFDTFLYVQTVAGRREILPGSQEQMVHPSQVICDFVRHRAGSAKLSQQVNSLMMIPYFMAVGGEKRLMRQLTTAMRRGERGIDFFGNPLQVHRLKRVHVEWLDEQITRLERALTGEVREDVQAYIDGLYTVGRHRRGRPAEPESQPAQPQTKTAPS